jgi:hypothetical protein
MRKETTRPESSKDRTRIILDYALMLVNEDKREIAERYKNRERMTPDEVKLARSHAAEIRIHKRRLRRGT